MDSGKSLQDVISAPRIDAERIVALMTSDRTAVDAVLREISSGTPRVRFGCSKSLVLLSERHPGSLYPKIEEIFKLLESENQIIKWNAIAMLGNLAAVDRDQRIPGVLKKLTGFLSCGELITANNAISALGKIGRAFPQEQARITRGLIGIEQAAFDTDECRNIAIGKSILAMEIFLEPGKAPKEVLDFARNQTSNRRNATAAKAKAFLRKYQEAGPKIARASR